MIDIIEKQTDPERVARTSVIEDAIKRTAEEMAERFAKKVAKEIVDEKNDILPGTDDVDTPLERTKTKETADSLAKIGGFVGASSRMLTVQEQQLKTQKATKDLLEKGIKIKGEL